MKGLAGRVATRIRAAATGPASAVAARAMFAVVGAPALVTDAGTWPAGPPIASGAAAEGSAGAVRPASATVAG